MLYINEILSNEFTNQSNFEKEYRAIKKSFAEILGIVGDFRLQKGIVILQINIDGNWINYTSSDKITMKDAIRSHKGSNFRLRIKENTYGRIN